MHLVLVIGLLGLLISGSWAFRSEPAVRSFLGSILTERLRQSATDEERNTPVESQPRETEQPAEAQLTDAESTTEAQSTETESPDEPQPTQTESPDEPQPTQTEPPAVSSNPSRQTPIDRAREQLADSPKEAVRIAYSTTRRHFDSSDEATSREFYRNNRDRVSATDDLQRLVEIYERAMFREKIERDEAEKAVEAASTLVSELK